MQTGTVGQRFIQLLENHPVFELAQLGASPRSQGKLYSKAVNWKISSNCPDAISAMTVQSCEPVNFPNCRIIFSGLDSDVAGDVEIQFANAGFAVFSNSKNHRMDPCVPLCVPLVNTQHMDIIPHQQKVKKTKGFIVTNANCSTTGLVVPLKALALKFGPIDRVFVTTLQAISGGGYPGVPSLDILDNIVPYIDGEEEKIEQETKKILGSLNTAATLFNLQDMKISATCNRVAVLDGHTECVSVGFATSPGPSIEQVLDAFTEYTCEAQSLGVSTAPAKCITVCTGRDRPQPRLDRDCDRGLSVSVGRVRKCNLLDVKFTLLAHNTVLGAAGSSIMNAEVAVKKGLI